MKRKIYNQLYVNVPEREVADELLFDSQNKVDLNNARRTPRDVTVINKPFEGTELLNDDFELQYYDTEDEWRRDYWGTSGVLESDEPKILSEGERYVDFVTADEPPRKWFEEFCKRASARDTQVYQTSQYLNTLLTNHENDSLLLTGHLLDVFSRNQLERNNLISMNYYDDDGEYYGQLIYTPTGREPYIEYRTGTPEDDSYENFIDGHEYSDHLFDKGE